MIVDAKVIMPYGLLQCLLDDQGDAGGWEVLGILGAVNTFLRGRTDEWKKRTDQQRKTDERFYSPSK